MKYPETFANNPHFLLHGSGVVTIVLSQDEHVKNIVHGDAADILDTVAVGIYALRTGGYHVSQGKLPLFNQLVRHIILH